MEIFLLGVWGRVCSRLMNLFNWHVPVVDTTETSTVVCRELGYLHTIPLDDSLYYSFSTIYDTEPIWLDVTCNGSETSLTQCSNLGLGVHNCTHENDFANILAVNCSGEFIICLLCIAL